MNMMPNQRNILSAILRTDLLAFAQKSFDHLYPGMKFEQNWHHEAISHELNRLMAGETRNLIINVPPRSLKSFLVSIVLPAFMLGRVRLPKNHRRGLVSDDFQRCAWYQKYGNRVPDSGGWFSIYHIGRWHPHGTGR
jgi:hypothetical protein